MYKLFLIIPAIVCVMSAPAAMAGGDPGLARLKADCIAHGAHHFFMAGGTYKCDSNGNRDEIGSGSGSPATTSPVSSNMTYEQWRADCTARGARFYTADEWNASGMSPHADPGMTFCHSEGSVKVY